MDNKLIQVNSLDLTAELMALDRYDTESIGNFIDRVKTYYANDPSSTKEGLSWALMKDLALPPVLIGEIWIDDIECEVLIEPTGMTLSGPDDWLQYPFFSTSSSGEITLKPDVTYRPPQPPFYTDGFDDIFDDINNDSADFSISWLQKTTIAGTFAFWSPIYRYNITLSPFHLMHGSNLRDSGNVLIPLDLKKVQLEKYPIKPGTLIFDDTENYFVTEVASEDDVVVKGDYYIDYENGIIYFYGIEEDDQQLILCRYLYVLGYNTSFKLYLTPIQVVPWYDESLKRLFFNMWEQSKNWYQDAMPIMLPMISELRSAHASYK